MAISHWSGHALWALPRTATADAIAARPDIAQTLDRVAVSSTFAIGFRDDAPPFPFRDEDGAETGFAIELCRQVAVRGPAV